MISLLTLSLLLATHVRAGLPSLNYNEFGDKLGILGQFDSLSLYTINSTEFLNTASTDDNEANKLYIRNSTSSQLAAQTNGHISNLQVLTDDTILINGDFSEFNGQSCQTPVIYNITSKDISSIFSSSQKRDLPQLNGDILTTFVDGDLIYFGGNFTYQNSSGVVIYNQKTKELSETPFLGFGDNAIVNAITKQGSDSAGSIIFGGDFDTLGIPQLLQYNITFGSNSTNHTNSTNTSLITAEQILSLKHGIITDVNGDGSNPSSVVCPSTGGQWAPQPNSGGEWLVELPDQMKGLTPTKARLYVPSGDDAINLFRIYSYPNNGIMNLTYIDPITNDLKYCDAWCPLAALKDLTNATKDNRELFEDGDFDEDVFVDENGSYSTYYDSSTQTKSLSYGANYQEFAFANEVGIDQIGITVISWYGSKGSLAGFELYSNSIVVYGNETLNEPNCGNPSENLVTIDSGDFSLISDINPAIDTGYLVSTSGGKVSMYPNITYSGDYSIIILTPGCLQDNSCSSRGSVNVTVFDTESNVLATHQIWQTNDYDKFDYLFYGHLDGSSLSDGQNRIEIESDDSSYMVLDKIKATIVELDNYYDTNSTNHTHSRNSSGYDLTELKLSGLFEYSIANFSDFDISKVYNSSKEILSTNTYVGNSSINVLSSKLSNSTVKQFNSDGSSLVILGDFNSKDLNLSDSNVITLKLGDYNTTSHSVVASKRDLSTLLYKREDIFGADFNDSITDISNYYNSRVFIGKFTVESDSISDLSSKNSSVSSANNFVIYNNNDFWSFGNDFIDQDFDSFTNISIKSTEYFIFSASSTGYSTTWDNTNKKFLDSNDQINITQALTIGDQEIISGSNFAIPDLSIVDIGFVNKSGTLNGTEYNITGSITHGYYINDTVSVLAGDFNSGSIQDVAFLGTNLTGLNGITFKDTIIQTLYVDSSDRYLVIGFNGSVTTDEADLTSGILVYDLKNNSIADFQPAELTTTSGQLQINSVVLYNDGDKLLVGGNFDNAGSLTCSGLCIYDIHNTRWTSPASGLGGTIEDMVFIKSDVILVAGDLTYDSQNVNFLEYNIKDDKFSKVSQGFNDVSATVSKLVISDDDTDKIGKLTGKFLGYSNQSISGFDGSKWSNISGIEFSDTTKITDMKLVSSDKTSSNNQSYFSNGNVLLVAGQFNLTDYGLVNIGMFDGKTWYPWIYSVLDQTLGDVNVLLIKDQYRSLSSDDLKNKKSVLSKGKVIGISLACALGSVTLLSLLYLVPYFLLFRKRDDEASERIGEREMMDAVNPTELFHEIDLHRNQ